MKHQNRRHLISFVVATIVYGASIGSVFGLFASSTQNTKETPSTYLEVVLLEENTPTIQQIQTQKIITKTLEKVQPTTKNEMPKEVVKEIKKEIVQEQPKLQSIQQSTPKIAQKSIEKDLKDIVETPKTQIQTPTVAQIVDTKPITNQIHKPIVHTEQRVSTEEISKKREVYFHLLKQMIEKNKYYPPNAIRRGIEGDLKIKFIISNNGNLISIEKIEGNRVFHTSIKEAISNSFPLLPPKNILVEDTVLNLVISYKLN